eukprot:g1059.t1
MDRLLCMKDWMQYATTLRDMDSNGFYFATFIVFTAFCTIGFFNVVTGIFVDSALASANAFRSRDDVIADHEDQKSEEKKDRKSCGPCSWEMLEMIKF